LAPMIRARFLDDDHIDLEVLVPLRQRAAVTTVRVAVTPPPGQGQSGAVLSCRIVTPAARAATRQLIGVATVVFGAGFGLVSAFNTSTAPGYRVLDFLFGAGMVGIGLLAFTRPKLADQKPVLRWLATNVGAVVPDEPPLLPWFT
jgi:hypothetical protein